MPVAKRDYYEVLGVSKSATADEIKRAFRKKAVEHHPDKTGGEDTQFKEAQEAYETLKDPKKRAQYDQFGQAGSQFGGGSGYNPFEGFGGFGQGSQVEFDIGDLGDVFGSFFGGAAQTRTRPRTSRGRDVETAITLSFEESIFGVEKILELSLEEICSHCQGKRAEPGSKVETCKTCHGRGEVVRTQSTILGQIQQRSVCPTCEGRGEVPDKACSVCRGKGTVRAKQELRVKIPAGIQNGETIRVREKGEAAANGHKGDLYLNIRVRPHSKFIRQGQSILSEQAVSMVEAALGSEIKVDTVDGPVTIKVPAGTQSGQTFKLSGKGVPAGSRRGDHLVTLNVEIPKRLSKRQKELLQEFAEQQKKGWL